MKREIENIFTTFPDYGCFACDPNNSQGLRLRFFADDEKGEVFTHYDPKEHLAGFPGILHGGVQCALIDEVAFWTLFDKYKKIALTSSVEMEFLRTVKTSSVLEARGRVTEMLGRKVTVDAEILDNNKTCTKGRVTYHIPKREITLRILGKQRFTDEFLQYLED